MSVAATNIMWQKKLKPHLKIVLLALADVADEKGYCWPSIAYLATQSVMDKRSVQRALKTLCELGLLIIKPRFIKDKIQTSNSYFLVLNCGGGKLTPQHEPHCHEGAESIPPRDGVGDIQTTKKHTRTKKLLPNGQLNETESTLNSNDYKFPKQFSLKNRKDAEKMLACLPLEIANGLLEDLGNKLNNNSVASPMAYLFTLINLEKNNEYIKEIDLNKKIVGTNDSQFKRQRNHLNVDKSKIKSHLKKMHEVLDSKKSIDSSQSTVS